MNRLSDKNLVTSETLPTYQPSVPDLRLPGKPATPDEIRTFLEQVMLSRGSNPDRAKQAAAKWTLGGGEELREYPAGMYRDVRRYTATP